MELPDIIENVKEGNIILREAKERICLQSKEKHYSKNKNKCKKHFLCE